MRVVSVAEMRALEEATIAAGTSEAELQQRAGRAAANALYWLGQGQSIGSVLSLVGPGNNGRDAWLAAAALGSDGWNAALYLTPRHMISDAELVEFAAAGGRVMRHVDNTESLLDELAAADVVFDGLVGIGTRGALRSPLDAIAESLNRRRAMFFRPYVIAVDTPSGFDADTGQVVGVAIRADATVVLGGAKRGLLTPAAVPYTGQLVFADIGIVAGPPNAPEIVDTAAIRGLLGRRPADAHKDHFGRLLVIAGSERYIGAAYLAGAAAVRTGAGVVGLAVPRWLRDVVAARLAEVVYLLLPDGGLAGAWEASVASITADLDGYSALAIGPGLSMDGGVGNAVAALLRERARRGIPAVVDADGLNALARHPDWPDWIGSDVVMTPHAGELARLTGGEYSGEQPPWERARALAHRWGVTLVIKGAFTAIGSGDEAWAHARPNPALATAGTGDVLTGIIGGLLAQGLDPAAAARFGVWMHAQAGAVVASRRPAGGLMASELLDEIPAALEAAARPQTVE